MKAKVCILAARHPVLDDRVFYKEAKTLHKAGYEVSEIVPLNEDGFLIDRSKNPIAQGETTIDGIKIIGYKEGNYSILGLPKTFTIGQLLRYATNGWQGLGQEPYADLIKKGIEVDADIYHCHEKASLYAGLRIKRKLQEKGRNPKLICDVREFWSAKKIESKFKQMLWSKSIKLFEKKAFKHVDYFITVNQIIRSYLLIKSEFIRTEVLYNGPALSIFKDSEHVANNSKVTICHEGTLPFNRGLKEMLEVIRMLKAQYNTKVRFLIIGDVFGKERTYYDEKVKEYQIEDVVERTGWLPYEEVWKATAKADIGINFLNYQHENNMFASPIKIFNYMRYGLPIVTVDVPETRRIVLDSECGVVVKERTAESLTKALSYLIDNPQIRQKMGENGKKAIIEEYSWDAMEKKLLRVYEELISDPEYIV
jgi:glycosyltransferase involved in cell wall biosynthesis